MPTRDEAIQHTRSNVGPEHPDHSSIMSEVTFENIHLLSEKEGFLALIQHHLDAEKNPGDTVNTEESSDHQALFCTLSEKNLALSLARRVEDAYKGNHPLVEIHNPEDNEFYRITVTFRPQK